MSNGVGNKMFGATLLSRLPMTRVGLKAGFVKWINGLIAMIPESRGSFSRWGERAFCVANPKTSPPPYVDIVNMLAICWPGKYHGVARQEYGQ